jgi:16S rRNA processing protein RimM
VENCNQAEDLRNSKLLVPESDRPKLRKGEYHVLDLIGLEVFLQDTGESIGKVVDILSAGHDLLEVKPHSPTAIDGETPVVEPKAKKPKNLLIPFVTAIAPVVDLQAGRIEITPPPGLLEIND